MRNHVCNLIYIFERVVAVFRNNELAGCYWIVRGRNTVYEYTRVLLEDVT
jgi:hypothetical protein